MTIKIGICDDNPQQVQVLQLFLTQIQLKDLAVVHATDPNESIMTVRVPIMASVFFLMPMFFTIGLYMYVI